MSWTVPGGHERKSKFIGYEFIDGSIWMQESGERPPKKQIAYKIFRREDGSTFKRSFAKPYSNEANKEKWKATQFFDTVGEFIIVAALGGLLWCEGSKMRNSCLLHFFTCEEVI